MTMSERWSDVLEQDVEIILDADPAAPAPQPNRSVDDKVVRCMVLTA